MEQNNNNEKILKWWQLSLFGIGSIIGTGFFLGSSIAINKSGPSVLITFILAAIGTYIVFDSLAKMTAQNPKEGAFRTYAKDALGRWAGFSTGWVYWSSEMLIMGSQLTALSLFTQFWFPDIPIWIFATGYAICGLGILLAGTKNVNRLENLFAVIKIAAIFMFIVIAGAIFFGVINGGKDISVPSTIEEIFPNGMNGLWTGFIFAFYAFGGIEVMGLMASKLKNPKDAPKSGKTMLMLLTVIYIISIGLAIILVPWDTFNSEQSPFLTALTDTDITFFPHVFNGALIIAGFSTMVAALYGVSSILVTLAEDGDAPSFFAKSGKLNIPFPALVIIVIGLIGSIILALVMPNKIYEYVTTGAGLMLLYNWIFILLSSRKLLRLTLFGHMKVFIGIGLMIAAISGTLVDSENRPGFFISLGFVLIIGLFTLFMLKRHKKTRTNVSTLFKRLKEE